MDQTSGTKNSQSLMVISAVIIIAILGLGFWQFNKTKGTQEQKKMVVQVSPTTTTTTTAPTSAEVTGAKQETSQFKDGTYKATGNYVSPGGPEEIGVSVTLKNGVVTEAEVQPMAERPMSKQFQGKFKEGFKEFVVGKPINEIALTVVNGSSLSPKGFMDALQKIEQQAT